jgi:hypothetical protein
MRAREAACSVAQAALSRNQPTPAATNQEIKSDKMPSSLPQQSEKLIRSQSQQPHTNSTHCKGNSLPRWQSAAESSRAAPKRGREQGRAEESHWRPECSTSSSTSPPRSPSLISKARGVAKYAERGEQLIHSHRRRQPGQRQVYVAQTQEDKRHAYGAHLTAYPCATFHTA